MKTTVPPAVMRIAREVRRWVLKQNSGCSRGMCEEASLRIKDRASKKGIGIEVCFGRFRTDFRMPSCREAHYWCEYKGTLVDVTADQFNCDMHQTMMPAIVVGRRWKGRYLTAKGKPKYS